VGNHPVGDGHSLSRGGFIKAAASTLIAGAFVLCLAGAAVAQGTIEWAEIQLSLDPAGRAQITYQTRWRTGAAAVPCWAPPWCWA
jgi:hypothetical protein